MSTTNKPYALNAKLVLKPERRDEFIKIIKEDQKGTLSEEPGALQFVVGEDTTKPNTFYLHEQYTSEDAFDAHSETPHYAPWKEFCDTDPFESEPVVDFYYGTHDPEKVPVRPAFCLNVELCIKAEVRDEFLEVIANNQQGTNNHEPLALQYVYGESTTTPNSFYFHEQYTGKDGGKEGFDAHASAPHFAVWEEFAATEPFTKPPVVSFYRALE